MFYGDVLVYKFDENCPFFFRDIPLQGLVDCDFELYSFQKFQNISLHPYIPRALSNTKLHFFVNI